MTGLYFRKVRGHVVPIRMDIKKAIGDAKASGATVIKINPNKLQGAAMAAGGLGVAAASGSYAANLVRGAAHAENQARTAAKVARKAYSVAKNQGPLFAATAGKQYIKAGHEALKTMAKSRQILNSAYGIRNAGVGAGAALIAAGAHRAMSKKPDAKTTAAIGTGAAIASQFMVRSSYLKSIGSKGTKVAQAMKAAARAMILKKFGG